MGQRVAVFAVFAALVAAGFAALFPGRPASAPSVADLASLESKMALAARLHSMLPAPAPAGPAGWCSGCHPGLPHQGTGIGAALLNEHSSHMDCLLCHWPAAAGPRPAPAWQVASGAGAFLTVHPRVPASTGQLTALRAAAMAGRRCFSRGPDCTACHRPGGLGPMMRPGSTPTKAASLERLEDYFTLAPGRKWYFPQIQ